MRQNEFNAIMDAHRSALADAGIEADDSPSEAMDSYALAFDAFLEARGEEAFFARVRSKTLEAIIFAFASASGLEALETYALAFEDALAEDFPFAMEAYKEAHPCGCCGMIGLDEDGKPVYEDA